MHTTHQVWYSPRIGHDMGVAVFGHWGPPLLAFPTSHGDEWELQRHGLIDAIGDFIDAGRVKVFCVGSNNTESFLNEGAPPAAPKLAAAHVRRVHPRRGDPLHLRQLPEAAACRLGTMGASLGAYHAANTLFHYPHLVKRCYEPVRDLQSARTSWAGCTTTTSISRTPSITSAGLTDPWFLEQLATCEIRLATGSGPYEKSAYWYAMSGVLAHEGIRHHLDDWGERGGHDWAYWKAQLREYISRW